MEIYRVFQEILNNVIKHSGARSVDVAFIEQEDDLNIMVEDDGIGFDMHLVSKGMGLDNMTKRMEAINGEIAIDSVPGRGTIINLSIPFEPLMV